VKRKKDKKLSVVDVAKRKRQVYLLEKLKNDKPLTRAELNELERYEANLPEGVVATQEEVARVFGVSTRTVQYWTRDGMPVRPEGTYNLLEIENWREFTKGGAKKDEKNVWQSKLSEIRYKKELLSYRKELGELVSSEDVERGMVTRIMIVKRSLLGLPMKLAPILSMKEPREVEVILYDALGVIIDEFAGTRRTSEEVNDSRERNSSLDAETEGSLEETGEDNGQSVGGPSSAA
jgi:phage terminase Nu1 subunit (DNA packaging protein)